MPARTKSRSAQLVPPDLLLLLARQLAEPRRLARRHSVVGRLFRLTFALHALDEVFVHPDDGGFLSLGGTALAVDDLIGHVERLLLLALGLQNESRVVHEQRRLVADHLKI